MTNERDKDMLQLQVQNLFITLPTHLLLKHNEFNSKLSKLTWVTPVVGLVFYTVQWRVLGARYTPRHTIVRTAGRVAGTLNSSTNTTTTPQIS